MVAIAAKRNPAIWRAERARRELFCVPGRVLHHARRIVLRLSPTGRGGPLLGASAALQALPNASGS
ncbi:MAG: hypothetical protein ACRD0U_09875 [Acidimicrobiales bacterium]